MSQNLPGLDQAIREHEVLEKAPHQHPILHSGKHGPLKLGKKTRIFEIAVEQLIRALAFVSFAAIILIFVFVFREALPMFTGTKAETHASTGAQVQSYGEEELQNANGQLVYDPYGIERVREGKVATTDPSNTDADYVTGSSSGTIEQEVYDPLSDDGESRANDSVGVDPGTSGMPSKEDALSAAMLAARRSDSLKALDMQLAEERGQATSVRNLLGLTWQPVSNVPKFGFTPLFIGTLKVTFLAILIGGPLAILAAMFTSSFAPRWVREIVKPGIELLAGFPSVVIGFFALIVMATVMQDLFGYQFRLNSLLGGMAMSLAVIPIIYTISEDALVSVPQSLKEASDALGATKWQTAYRVVLPAAVPGVFAAVVLGFGRAFGETMIALMATGNAPLTSLNIFEPVRTFSATIGAEMAEVVFGDQHYNVLFFIGAMLFVFTFSLNMVVEFWVRKRLLRRIQGKV